MLNKEELSYQDANRNESEEVLLKSNFIGQRLLDKANETSTRFPFDFGNFTLYFPRLKPFIRQLTR